MMKMMWRLCCVCLYLLALLAPLVAAQLRRPVTYIRVSRYAQDVFNARALLGVILDELLGRHDGRYTVADAPRAEELRGKRVLMVDDACASGGTLRAAARHCLAMGALEAHGLGLLDGGTFRQQGTVACITPWGTL